MNTYIALLRAVNVGGTGKLPMAELRAMCEAIGFEDVRTVGVLVRTPEEMAAVLAANPFADAAPNRNVVVFLDAAPASDALATASHRNGEEIALGRREIHIHYGDGMADSKLRIPAAKHGTARNMNTVAKLVEMALE